MTAPASPFVLLETPYGPVSVDARTIVGTVTQPAGEPWRVVFESHPGPIMDLTFFDGDKAEEAVLLLHAAREAHDDQRAEDARARVVGEAIREGAAVIAGQVAEALRVAAGKAVHDYVTRLEIDLAEERKLVAAYRAHVERVEVLLAHARATMVGEMEWNSAEWNAFLAEIDAALAGRGVMSRG